MQQQLPPNDEHIRPAGVDDATVKATGKLSEAFEKIEYARGLLYGFHQQIGGADIMISEAVELLEKAGHHEQAEKLRQDIVGLNVIPGHWTFQIVEAFDDTYYSLVKQAKNQTMQQLVAGKRHIYESEMKERNRTKGKRGHEARP